MEEGRIEDMVDWGYWKAVDSQKADKLIKEAAEYQKKSIDEIIELLSKGKEIEYRGRTQNTSPYKIRDGFFNKKLVGEAYKRLDEDLKRSEKKKLKCKSCGVIGYEGDYPFSTLPESGYCDDCV